MSLSKLSQPPAEDSEQPQAIVSSFKAKDTGRRRFSVQVTDSSPQGKRVCPVCGGRKDKGSKMCYQCYQAARNTLVTLTCAWCGKEFQRQSYEIEKQRKRGHQVFCSRECSQAHHAIAHARLCANCGKPMPNSRSTKYCSVECRRAARPKRKRTCKWCGAEMVPVSSRTQFCSRECASAAHSVRMRGKGNSHYKTGTSYAKWFAEMRPLIFERDGHSCVACQAEEQSVEVVWSGMVVVRTNLVAHHIDEDVTNNRPENLVTLCKKCHMTVHKSKATQLPWLGAYALGASMSMTSKWKDATTSLQKAYSSTTA